MLVAETVVAVTMLCSSAKRRSHGDSPTCLSVVSTSTIGSCQASSGRTLERQMTDDIEQLRGVRRASAKRSGDVFDVSVVMEDMDFARFDAVVQKELELYSTYPDFTFYFDIMSASELEAPSAVNAA